MYISDVIFTTVDGILDIGFLPSQDQLGVDIEGTLGVILEGNDEMLFPNKWRGTIFPRNITIHVAHLPDRTSTVLSISVKDKDGFPFPGREAFSLRDVSAISFFFNSPLAELCAVIEAGMTVYIPVSGLEDGFTWSLYLTAEEAEIYE